MNGSPQYEVQLQTCRMQFNLHELRRMIEEGRVEAQTPIRAPLSETWQRAGELIELADLLDPMPDPDPWSAWDRMPDPTTEEEMPTEEERDEEFEEAWEAEAPTEIDLKPIKPSRPTNLAVAPTPATPEPSGQLIDFPRRDVPAPPPAPAPAPEPLLEMRPRTPRAPRPMPLPDPPPPAQTRLHLHWGRLLILLSLGGAMIAMVGLYIFQTANPRLAPHPASPTTAAITTNMASAQGEAGSPLQALEDELRTQLRPGLLPLEREGHLQDALLIELDRLRLDVSSIEAPVEWSGRNDDIPEKATVNIHLRADANDQHLDYELAGAALVLGKYMQRYTLKVDAARLIRKRPDGSTQSIDLRPEDAQRFYIKRITAEDYLTAAR